MSSARKIVLESSEKKLFEVEEAVALESQTIKHEMEGLDADADRHPIPLPDVSSKILPKVIEYCRKHVDADPDRADELKAWDAEFVQVDQETLFDLIMAADYLKIKGLLDLTCQTVADMMKGKKPDEIRKIFNIKKEGRTNWPWSIFTRAKWGRCF